MHDKILSAREEIRQRLEPDSPAWLRKVFDELHAAHYMMGGDPFDMHIRAALAVTSESTPRDEIAYQYRVSAETEIERLKFERDSRDAKIAALLAPPPAATVERVAQAIHEGLGGNGWAYSNHGGDEMKACRDALLGAAKAAIAAAQP